jgi:hypothetical protein
VAKGSVRRAVTVPVPADRAFAVFTEEMSSWWPREYTWSEEDLDGMDSPEGWTKILERYVAAAT